MSVKISQLPAAVVPLSGTETIVLVQGGITSQAASGVFTNLATNAQIGTGYTLASTDNNKVITLNNGSAVTVTVPAGLGANFSCILVQKGAGQVGFVAAGGVTLNSYQNLTHLAGQNAMGTLVADVANNFFLGGTLA